MVLFIKKTLLYSERNEEKRKDYQHEITEIPLEKRVYIDESGIDHNMIQEYCWTKKGKEIIGNRSGTRARTSVLASLCGENIQATMRYQGTANTDLFLSWMEQILLPTLERGQTIIMDNASIHKSPKVEQLLAKVGCHLKYLPPYSPDFNPIEKYWAIMKKHIRKIRAKFKNIEDAIDEVLRNKHTHFQT